MPLTTFRATLLGVLFGEHFTPRIPAVTRLDTTYLPELRQGPCRLYCQRSTLALALAPILFPTPACGRWEIANALTEGGAAGSTAERSIVETAGLNSDAHVFMVSIQANVSATLWDPSTLRDTCSPSGSI
ncbi:hypothetical protein BJ322DRAFT_1070510 [Thelephora terrestris]|uniref:Uncharacterized protein n=1 Tax=Thelephora terrestris TaxID=56493 RepID=A0A9P6HE78_9AGAM|nr:hypothetical protein BJ322DRAFT_1070510 [Thelephora terrestris]